MPVTDVRNNVTNNYSFISAFIQDMTLFVWVTGRASYPNIGMVMIWQNTITQKETLLRDDMQ